MIKKCQNYIIFYTQDIRSMYIITSGSNRLYTYIEIQGHFCWQLIEVSNLYHSLYLKRHYRKLLVKVPLNIDHLHRQFSTKIIQVHLIHILNFFSFLSVFYTNVHLILFGYHMGNEMHEPHYIGKKKSIIAKPREETYFIFFYIYIFSHPNPRN